MDNKGNAGMPTDEDIKTLRELFGEVNTMDELRALLHASAEHYEPSAEEKELQALQNVMQMFEPISNLRNHPAANPDAFDAVVNSMTDEEVNDYHAAAAATIGNDTQNTGDASNGNEEKSGGKKRSKKAKKAKKSKKSKKSKKANK
jgi:Asp-tRNA(Asn)/Glu-tRNA(Gln) amidotransferase C subunit